MIDVATKVTSADIRAALKLRYASNEHALLFEVANGTGGAGDRRVYADALAFGLWPSHGHAIEGIEIKVSRSDFLCEMKKPGKSAPVFRYCDRWWLACPKDMVKPDELPPTWGLLELTGETLRQKVKAPKLVPEDMPRTFLASLLRRHAGVDEDMARVALQRETTRIHREAEERYSREGLQRYNREVSAAKTASEAWQKVLDETGIDFRDMHDAKEFCAAIKLVQELGTGWNATLIKLRSEAARLIEQVDASGLLVAATPRAKARIAEDA